MEMLIVYSDQQKRLIMLFSNKTKNMSDKVLLNNLDSFQINSSALGMFKAAQDLLVERINLPAYDEKTSATNAGDFLYRYLSKGYICLGDFVGEPKPDLSPWGVKKVRTLPKIGFGL